MTRAFANAWGLPREASSNGTHGTGPRNRRWRCTGKLFSERRTELMAEQSGERIWHLVTGEYPPQPGGVADYTRLVAQGLAAAGDTVHVWAARAPGDTPQDVGVTVHRLPDHFGR